MKTKDLTTTALLATLICVCAPFAVPVGPVPVTLATFAVYLAAASAGWKRGCLAVAVYILLGAAGMPVFSGFQGGMQKLLGVTGGFIMGYIPCALLSGLFADRYPNLGWVYPAGMVLGTLACYALGLVWFMLQTQSSFMAALLACVVPFLLGDALKIAAASLLSPHLHRLMARIVSKSR